jgi:hypothetical protein
MMQLALFLFEFLLLGLHSPANPVEMTPPKPLQPRESEHPAPKVSDSFQTLRGNEFQ